MNLERRIVCAAMRSDSGQIICSPRHWDSIAHRAAKASPINWHHAEQGFVNTWGEFLTREEAWKVAVANNQILRRVGGDEGRLYSENLY